MFDNVNGVELAIFTALFLAVSVMGFLAARCVPPSIAPRNCSPPGTSRTACAISCARRPSTDVAPGRFLADGSRFEARGVIVFSRNCDVFAMHERVQSHHLRGVEYVQRQAVE